MSHKVSATIDDALYDELLVWAEYFCGPGKTADYTKRALRSMIKRDRASWEKRHPLGSFPGDFEGKYQATAIDRTCVQFVQSHAK
jgi:hypothetical protein